jgi:dTDP-4-dehydrorhamnose 3,5-epimerase
MIEIIKTPIEGLVIVYSDAFKDDRGHLFESYTAEYKGVVGPDISFTHEVVSVSHKDVFRGMHFQIPPFEQGKLVQVLRGSVIDFILDIRPDSKTFGEYYSIILSGHLDHDRNKQVWIPPGVAHGFLSNEYDTVFHYKCTKPRTPTAERTIKFWNISDNWLVSEKDKNAITLEEYKETLK